MTPRPLRRSRPRFAMTGSKEMWLLGHGVAIAARIPIASLSRQSCRVLRIRDEQVPSGEH